MMAKKAAKPQNRAAQNTTLINLRALKKRVAAQAWQRRVIKAATVDHIDY